MICAPVVCVPVRRSRYLSLYLPLPFDCLSKVSWLFFPSMHIFSSRSRSSRIASLHACLLNQSNVVTLNAIKPHSPVIPAISHLGCASRVYAADAKTFWNHLLCTVYNIRVGWLSVQMYKYVCFFSLVPSLLAEICMFVCSQIDRSAGSQTQFLAVVQRHSRRLQIGCSMQCTSMTLQFLSIPARLDFALFRIIINRRSKYRGNKNRLIY